MEKMLAKVFEEKMKDGSIEKIVSDKIEQLVKQSLEDLFGYRGKIREQIKEKLEDVMGNVLETCNFSDYVVKLQTLINEVLPETAVVDYKRISENITELCGKKLPKSFSTIKTSEMFEKYKEFISKEEFDHYDVEEIEGNTAMVYCCISAYYDEIRFSVDVHTDEHEYIIPLRNYNGNLEISYEYFDDKRLSDLRFANSFELYILAIKNNFIRIEIDKADICEDVEVSVSY